MPRGASGIKRPGVGPKSHKLAEEFPAGTVLTDLCKKTWMLSSVIGQGGFGLIYLASDEISKPVDKSSANYVVKIEPKDNGPLYCEMQFYQRVAKGNQIQSYKSANKLKYLGVPPYIATGRQMFHSKEYRFLVMPRLGTDLQKYLVQNGGHFTPKTVFAVGLRMLDALQFLHENEYVHADVKAANILTGFSGGSEVVNEVYLVDYGLAYRYTVDGVHKEYKEDPRKAHDGTIEFTSRDAHKGVAPSRRADLEILGYCMLQWVCGKLPWEDKLSDPRYVADTKERLTANPELLAAACLPGPRTPSLDCLCKYMELVNGLKYDSVPDYKKLREMLRSAGSKAGLRDEWKLELPSLTGTKASKRKSGGIVKEVSPKKRKSSPGSPIKSPVKQVRKPVSKGATSKTTPKKAPSKTASPKKTVISKTKLKKSPVALPVPTKNGVKSPALNGSANAGTKKKRDYQMPPASKVASPKAAAPNKKTTVRRVRRVAAVQSDMCVQTSPGLLSNR